MIEARCKRTAVSAVAIVVAGLISAAVAATTSVSAAASPAGSSSGTYVALTPARVFDGRTDGVAAAHGTVGVAVLGRAGVPSTGVGAVALTLTATGQTSSGYATAYAAGTARPATSNLNFAAGQDVANSVVVPAGSGGAVDLYNGSVGSTDFVVDVAGYYRSGPATVAGAFTPLVPTRRLDTRIGVGGHEPVAGGVLRVNVGITDATVLMNLTVTGPTAGGHITAYPDGTTRPTTTNLSFSKGQTVANQIVVAVGATGVVDLYNASTGAPQLVLDVVGSYRPGTPTAPGAIQPLTPRRQLDTRTPPGRPVQARNEYIDTVDGAAGIPVTGVSSLLLDVTVVTPARSGYLKVQTIPTALGSSTLDAVSPATSSLNFTAGHTVTGLVLVAAGYDGEVAFYLRSGGSANIVVDVVGYTLDGPGASRGSISGAVEGLSQPAGGVTVDAFDGADVVASTVSAADGTYTVAGLPATTDGYVICAVTPTTATASQCYKDVEWDSAAPPPGTTPVPLVGGTLLADLTLYLAPPLPTGVITGRLTAAGTGTPIAGAQVRAVDKTATTGSDGRYQINDVYPGSYQVCFTPDNTAAGTPPTGYADVCHAGNVAVADGHTTAGVDGVVPIGAAISGRVTAAADGTPIANVVVSGGYTGTAHGYYDVTTAADGTFHILGLPGGVSATVCFEGGTGGPSAGGYLAACHHTGAGTAPTPIPVTAGTTVTGIDAALASGGGISGTVHVGSRPAGYVIVTVYSTDGTEQAELTADFDGNYQGTGMAPGTYLVCFDATESDPTGGTQCYNDATWSGGNPPASANPVTVTAGAMTEHIDAVLAP